MAGWLHPGVFKDLQRRSCTGSMSPGFRKSFIGGTMPIPGDAALAVGNEAPLDTDIAAWYRRWAPARSCCCSCSSCCWFYRPWPPWPRAMWTFAFADIFAAMGGREGFSATSSGTSVCPYRHGPAGRLGLAVGGTLTQAILRNPWPPLYPRGGIRRRFRGPWWASSSAAGFPTKSSPAALLPSPDHFPADPCGGADQKRSSETLILAGVAFMYLFSSLTSFMQYVSTIEQVHQIVFWFFGSLSKVGWTEIGIAAIMILAPQPLLMRWGWDLNLLMTGGRCRKVPRRQCGPPAHNGGDAGLPDGRRGDLFLRRHRVHRTCRPPYRPDAHRQRPPVFAAGLGDARGGADSKRRHPGRSIWAPQVIPIGIMTAFIGVPFFLLPDDAPQKGVLCDDVRGRSVVLLRETGNSAGRRHHRGQGAHSRRPGPQRCGQDHLPQMHPSCGDTLPGPGDRGRGRCLQNVFTGAGPAHGLCAPDLSHAVSPDCFRHGARREETLSPLAALTGGHPPRIVGPAGDGPGTACRQGVRRP